MEVLIGGRKEKVNLLRKKVKNITLRVDRDAEIRVTCPPYATLREIENLIYRNEAWILDQKLKRKQDAEINREGICGGKVYWLGEAKEVVWEPAKRDSVMVDGDQVIFRMKEKDEAKAEAAFRRAANRKLLALAEEHRHPWDEVICRAHRLPQPEIRTRYMTSRWGVCYPQKHVITLSTRLIHYPEECFEYVLLHEYAHFLVPNHSAAFHAVVGSYMPDYRQRRKLLK